jgi:hypothetical protein
MPLSAYTPERRKLKFKRVEFQVRGITTEDVTLILSRRLGDVQQAALLFHKARTDVLTRNSLDAFVTRLCMDFPWLVAEVISVAADEPDTIEQAKTLPMPIQIAALLDIMTLTFEEAGGLKNWLAAQIAQVREVLPELKEALSPLLNPEAHRSNNSTGPAAAKLSS